MSDTAPTTITQKIIGYTVVKPGENAANSSPEDTATGPVRTIMSEHVERPATRHLPELRQLQVRLIVAH